MTQAVTELIVRADGALAQLDRFGKEMSGAGAAADKTNAALDRGTGAVSRYEAATAKLRAQQQLGLAVTTQSVERIDKHLAAYQRLEAKTDQTTNLRIKLEREAAREAVTATNAVLMGYASQEQALQALTRLEAQHVAQLGQVGNAAENAAGSMKRLGAANDNLSFQRRNLQFQLFDVGQSLAGGMPAAMVLMQQGPQIAQIWGTDEGGVGRAFAETGKMAGGMFTKFWPLLALIGAFAGGVAVLEREIDKAGAKSVNFMDVAKAAFQVPAQAIYDFLEPAIKSVSGWWGAELDIFASQTKDLVNFLVRSFLVGFETIKAGIMTLPDAFIVAGEAAANGFLNGIEWLVQQAAEKLNGLMGPFNALRAMMGQEEIRLIDPTSLTIPDAQLGGAAAQKRIDGASSSLDRRNAAIQKTDYAGQFFGSVMDQAQSNATTRLAEENAGAMNKATSAADKMADAYAKIIDGGQEFIAQQQIEAQALGMSAEAASRMRFEQDMLNQAANDHIALTSSQRAEIGSLAITMASMEERTRSLTEAYDFSKQTFGGFMSDFRNSIMEGQGLWTSFANAASTALDRIADKLMENAPSGEFAPLFVEEAA